MAKPILLLMLTTSLALPITALHAESSSPRAIPPMDKVLMGEKCDRLKKTHEDMLIEIKDYESQEVRSDRLDYLRRELPRVRVEMEYYCEKS